MNPTFTIFLRQTLCCQLIHQIDGEGNYGELLVKSVKNAIAYELFQSEFSVCGKRFHGFFELDGNSWGYTEYEDIIFALDSIKMPWDYSVGNPRTPINFIVPDNIIL